MSNRERILDSAVALFNQHGVSNVSTGDIASDLDISKGNLTYHFPHKESLMLALVQQMQSDIATRMDEVLWPEPGLKGYLQFLQMFAPLVERYAFFFTDVLDALRLYPDVARQYTRIMEQRLTEFSLLFKRLEADGVLRTELYPGYYREFQHNTWRTVFGWQTQKYLLTDLLQDRSMLDEIITSLYPLLTAEGIHQLHAWQEQQP